MQFRQVGKRIQVLAPAWDAKAKRTRQRLAMSFPADEMPICAHVGEIKAIDGLDREAAALEISEWIATRRKEIQDERLKNVTYIKSNPIEIYESIGNSQIIDIERWSLSVSLYNDETSVCISRAKRAGNNTLEASIFIDKGRNKARIFVTDHKKMPLVKFNMKIVDAIEECNALIEAFEG